MRDSKLPSGSEMVYAWWPDFKIDQEHVGQGQGRAWAAGHDRLAQPIDGAKLDLGRVRWIVGYGVAVGSR